MLSAYIENDRLSETEIDTSVPFFPRVQKKEAINVADFMIRFLICNVFISGIIGILLIAKRIFKGNLSSRMQYNLWFLLLGLLVVPFIPFRLIGFPQILSWLRTKEFWNKKGRDNRARTLEVLRTYGDSTTVLINKPIEQIAR